MSRFNSKLFMAGDDEIIAAPKNPVQISVGDKVKPTKRDRGMIYEVVSVDGDVAVLKSPSGLGDFKMNIADLTVVTPTSFGKPAPFQRSQKSLEERAAPYIKKVVDHLEQYAADIASEVYEQFGDDFASQGGDVHQDQDVDNAISDSITDAVIDYMAKIRVPEELLATVQNAAMNELHYPGGRS